MGYCKRCGDYFPTLTNSSDVCPRCAYGMIPKPVTNADHIRAMTDEELAKFLNWHAHDPWTSPSGGWNEWLQQPCEEGTV